VSRERVFEDRVMLPQPLDVVFEFFGNAANLERLTPTFLNFEILSLPEEMAEGVVIDYRLRIHGVPVRWRTLIQTWEPPHRFVDEQVKGPYRMWVHEHTFRQVDGGTEIYDRVRYRVPGGVLEPLIHQLVVARDVRRIFAYRKQVLTDLFS